MITMMDTVTMSLNRIHIVSIRACSSFIFSTEISCDLRPFRHNRRSRSPQEAKLGKNDGREGGEGGPILIDPWELKTDN